MKSFFYIGRVKTLLILLVLLVLSVSCRKVSELSDNNNISTVSISGVKPANAVFDAPRIEGKKIIIPLRFGKYLFPLDVKLDVEKEQGTDKILGLGADGYIRFESILSINEISVVAESGLTAKYEVVLEEIPSNDLAEVEKFTVKTSQPENCSLINEALIDYTNSTINIYTISTIVPFTIVPEITLSAGAGFKDYKANTPIVFESLSAQKSLSIISESGKEEIWKISLSPAKHFSIQNSSQVPDDVLDRLNFGTTGVKATSFSSGLEIYSLLVSNSTSTITLIAKSSQNNPSGNVKIELITGKYSALAGIESGENLSFSIWGEKKSFFLCDIITGWAKEWNIEWRSFNEYAEILSVSKTGYSSADGKIEIGNFTVNRSERTINVPVLSNGSFPLIINGCSSTLSSGATSTLPATLSFSSINDTVDFSVTKDALSENWGVVLTNNYTPKSSQNEVLDFISGIPSGGYLFSSKYLENGISRITLIVDNYDKMRRLVISPAITVSSKAKIQGTVSGAPIILSPDNDFQFSVIAENGRERFWNIKLIVAPQIDNSNFEKWSTHPLFSTIPLTISPSDGSGWNSSNNPSVQGLTRVAGYNSLYATKLQTQLSVINFANIVRVTSLASGGLFLGKFKYSILAQDVYHPQNMTKFGIPFTGKTIPVAFSLNYKYSKGMNLIKTTPKFSSVNIPAFEDPAAVEGSDKAIVWVELWHHSGTDEFDIQKEPVSNKIARGEFVISENSSNWMLSQTDIKPVNGAQNLTPTHIVVTMSSSRDGDLFTGADGSSLIVDNFKLHYYSPGQGVKILN
jgi:hypothetical protein